MLMNTHDVFAPRMGCKRIFTLGAEPQKHTHNETWTNTSKKVGHELTYIKVNIRNVHLLLNSKKNLSASQYGTSSNHLHVESVICLISSLHYA